MLKHVVIGPNDAGKFIVAYPTPGTRNCAAVCDGCTADEARGEALRLNRMQLAREQAIRADRQARGLAGVHPCLKGVN